MQQMRPNPHDTADLAAFTEEILNGKHHFLYIVYLIVSAREDESTTIVSFCPAPFPWRCCFTLTQV